MGTTKQAVQQLVDELVVEAERMIRRARELQVAVNRQCEDELVARPDLGGPSVEAIGDAGSTGDVRGPA